MDGFNEKFDYSKILEAVDYKLKFSPSKIFMVFL